MKIFFFDIETVPTDKSLQENGLLEEQIKTLYDIQIKQMKMLNSISSRLPKM